jgi:hypothetical protein
VRCAKDVFSSSSSDGERASCSMYALLLRPGVGGKLPLAFSNVRLSLWLSWRFAAL